MGELQGIQDSLTYAISQQQTSSIRVSTDNQAALQALQNSNKRSAPQIMQTTILHLFFPWIPSHKDIKGNE